LARLSRVGQANALNLQLEWHPAQLKIRRLAMAQSASACSLQP
jgi:hypothetical protein